MVSPSNWPGILMACLVALAIATLGGCVDPSADGPSAGVARTARQQQRPTVDMQAAAVAFVSLDGPPSALAMSIIERTRAEAQAHRIGLADVSNAQLLMRGYLTAAPGQGGIVLSSVWDVFDAQKRRVTRIDTSLLVQGKVLVQGMAADPWAVVDEAAQAELAAHSIEGLEDYLAALAEPSAGNVAEAASDGASVGSMTAAALR